MPKRTPERIIDSRQTAAAGRALTYSAGSSSGTSLADHDHTGTANSGGDLNAYVHAAGDTMTGALILAADPSAALHAATKQYADGIYSTFFPYLVVTEDAVLVHDGEVIWSV